MSAASRLRDGTLPEKTTVVFCTDDCQVGDEPNMALLVDVLDKFKFVGAGCVYTKDNHWLILRPSLRTDKRKCCKCVATAISVGLFDLIIDAGEQFAHSRRSVFFHRYPTLISFCKRFPSGTRNTTIFLWLCLRWERTADSLISARARM